MQNIEELANLLKQRNSVDLQISKIIDRPAEKGHVGEYIAASIFDIDLNNSATKKGNDGYFKSGGLSEKTVNIKWYSKLEGILDINMTSSPPEYYLVLAGPRSQSLSSRGSTRPWLIHSVFLFNHDILVTSLKEKSIHLGVATSVTRELWDMAEIHPIQRNNVIQLSDLQKKQLNLFH